MVGDNEVSAVAQSLANQNLAEPEPVMSAAESAAAQRSLAEIAKVDSDLSQKIEVLMHAVYGVRAGIRQMRRDLLDLQASMDRLHAAEAKSMANYEKMSRELDKLQNDMKHLDFFKYISPQTIIDVLHKK